MKTGPQWLVACALALALIAMGGGSGYAQNLKVGYIHSQKILASYKEAQDAQKKLDELNARWEADAREMQRELKELQDQLESQSLLLSEEKKAEKAQGMQNKYIRFQQFQQEKWGQNGELFKKNAEFMEPVIEKVNSIIKKVGEEENFDYIFDVVEANIVYASPKQTDLTERVLEELNSGLAKDGK